jgi:hypothetical protein
MKLLKSAMTEKIIYTKRSYTDPKPRAATDAVIGFRPKRAIATPPRTPKPAGYNERGFRTDFPKTALLVAEGDISGNS